MSKIPEKKLIHHMRRSISEYAKQNTKDTLGDRSKYIGASDIGGCPFQTIMSKLNPPKYSLEKELIFFRGHIAEEFVARGLTGLNTMRQYEAKSELDGFPLIAHLDFFITSKNRDVIVEVKTVGAPIEDMYESWVLQVTFQMGLVFQQTGRMPEGYVLAIDDRGWIDEFKVEFNDAIFELCLSKASHLISALREECKPKAIIQYYCSDCPFKMECPKQGQFAEDLPTELSEDLKFIKKSKEMAKEAKKRGDRVKEYMVNTGVEALKEEATQTVVTTKEMQTTRVNTDKLKALYPEVYEACARTSSYYRMNIL